MHAVELSGVSKAYHGKTVFSGLSLTLEKGVTSAVLAPSGYGKTTLLRLILGLEKPDAGQVRVLAEKCACVFQEDRLCEDFGAEANIRLGVPEVSRAEMAEALQAYGLGGQEGKPVRAFSGGMKRRVALLRAVLSRADLVVLDEPFDGLDEALKTQVMAETARRLLGKTVILVTHEMEEAEAMGASRVIRLDRLAADGTAE